MGYKIEKGSKCAVIGYGSWGTALVKILLENEQEVGWFITNPAVRERVENEGRNPKYLTNVRFPKEKIRTYGDINRIVEDYDILIFAVPSAFLCNVLEPLTVSLEDKFLISAIKGIVIDRENNYITIAEYFNRQFGIPFEQIGIFTGPCHAEEVALERLSYLNMVCKNPENARLLAARFNGPYIRTNTLSDIYGTEYAAVLKNIYAMAVGICKGQGYGDNFIAVLITNAAREMDKFLKESFDFERDLNTSPYLGDLLVTSYSQFSRNRSFGMMIGQGYSVKSARIELGMIAEGYFAAYCIHEICSRHGIDLPIADAVYGILYENRPVVATIRSLSEKLL